MAEQMSASDGITCDEANCDWPSKEPRPFLSDLLRNGGAAHGKHVARKHTKAPNCINRTKIIDLVRPFFVAWVGGNAAIQFTTCTGKWPGALPLREGNSAVWQVATSRRDSIHRNVAKRVTFCQVAPRE